MQRPVLYEVAARDAERLQVWFFAPNCWFETLRAFFAVRHSNREHIIEAREAPVPNQAALRKILFPSTVFFSAFLLFWTQLILGKFLLPWFGGTPAVWTTCMLFFQLLLLAGYAYAHLLTRLANALTQCLVHAALLLLAVALLSYLAASWRSPIIPGANWKPATTSSPVFGIISLLALAVGLPYFALSATGPLLQAWYERVTQNQSAYRLYSLSNLGSFLALFAFPTAFEPRLTLRTQGYIWSVVFLLFAISCAACAVQAAGTKRLNNSELLGLGIGQPGIAATAPRIADYVLWFGLSACASVVFLATTNQLCQDVAVVPLLWVLHLGVYLLSFVLCFEHSHWYARHWFHATFGLALFAACFLLHNGALGSLLAQSGLYLLVLCVVCMVCHGELARAKPHPRFLTSFYLAVAAGGAFGGIFVGLLAPRIFRGFWEFQLGLWAAAALLLLILVRQPDSWLYRCAFPAPVLVIAMAALLPEAAPLATKEQHRGLDHFPVLIPAVLLFYVFLNRKNKNPEPVRKMAAPICCAAAVVVTGLVLVGTGLAHAGSAVSRSRNFYGVLSVIPKDADDPTRSALQLVHGRISHGMQFHSEAYRRTPTTYYTKNSGLGLAILQARSTADQAQRKLRVGVVGLGVGTIAAYGRHGDLLRFYEINPQVVGIASDRRYFTYLSDSPARPQIVLGDARLSLEHELDHGDAQDFDVLAVDAFSGDSIPVHLLTAEAVSIYLQHLHQPDGILAIHITNSYLDLKPVIQRAAKRFGLNLVYVHSQGDGLISSECEWMLLSHSELPHTGNDAEIVDGYALKLRSIRPWTDDYSNLLQVLKR